MPKFVISSSVTTVAPKTTLIEAPNFGAAIKWFGNVYPTHIIGSGGLSSDTRPVEVSVDDRGYPVRPTPPPAPVKIRPGGVVRCVRGTRDNSLLVEGTHYEVAAIAKAGSVDHRGRVTKTDTVILCGSEDPIMWDMNRFTPVS